MIQTSTFQHSRSFQMSISPTSTKIQHNTESRKETEATLVLETPASPIHESSISSLNTNGNAPSSGARLSFFQRITSAIFSIFSIFNRSRNLQNGVKAKDESAEIQAQENSSLIAALKASEDLTETQKLIIQGMQPEQIQYFIDNASALKAHAILKRAETNYSAIVSSNLRRYSGLSTQQKEEFALNNSRTYLTNQYNKLVSQKKSLQAKS